MAAAEAVVPPSRAGDVPVASWRGIDVFATMLSRPPDAAALAVLGADDQARAARFAFADDARRYRVAHAWLRRRLAGGDDAAAARLRFAAGAQGKPRCDDPAVPRFNLSHSGDVAWIAVAGTGEIGVDVERLHGVHDAPALVATHFHPLEQAAWRRLPDERRTAAFLAVWTRKEACLKAIGSGLTVPPEVFVAGLGPGEALVELRHAGGVWKVAVTSVDTVPGCVGAVAILLDGAPTP